MLYDALVTALCAKLHRNINRELRHFGSSPVKWRQLQATTNALVTGFYALAFREDMDTTGTLSPDRGEGDT